MATPSRADARAIVDNGVGVKATALPQIDGTGVDRPDRNRARHSRSRSPAYGNGSRTAPNSSRRSRSPRGLKRPRDAVNESRRGDRGNPDPRRFRVHYEDGRDDSRRSRYSYDDDHRAPSRGSASGLPYDDRDLASDRDRPRERSRGRYPDKRPRKRSRSPYRPPRGGRDRPDRSRRGGDPSRRPSGRENGRGITNGHQKTPQYSREQAVSKRTPPDEDSATSADAKTAKGRSDGTSSAAAHAQPEPEPEPEPEEEGPVDADAEIERRRRRREELLAKKSSGLTPMLAQALHIPEKAAVASPAQTQSSTPITTELNSPRSVSSPSSPARGLQGDMSPAVLAISNDQELVNQHGKSGDPEDDGPSAADYDPTADMREDEKRDERRNGHIGPHGEVLDSELKAEIAPKDTPEPPQKPTEDDDDFDMFADDFDEEKFVAPKPVAQVDTAGDDRKVPASLAQPNGGGILEGDDKDGYYKIRIGEIMNGRYQVQSTLGKGMFSGVVRAMDITNKQVVAVKMMRNNDALRKGGFTEIAILQKLNESDPENRKHIVKFERHFEHKGHLCLAFENLSLNLREVLRKFGNNVGINLTATRAYAHQMFVALAHMRKCTIIHADLKPDNILVNESRNILKICDLGTAIDRSDAATAHNEITPYLVSRFYRAPEIILGMPYDYSVDMWSIGCTLYELYTGKILFVGDSNNQMLKAIMEIRGKFSNKLFRRGQLSHLHFDEMGNFISVEQDKTLGKTVLRTMAVVKPTRDLRTRLTAASGGMTDAEARDLHQFVDLLERCLNLNPDKRITPAEALRHPFFGGKQQ